MDQYVILKSTEEDKDLLVEKDDSVLLEELVKKYKADQKGSNVSLWQNVAKDFEQQTGIVTQAEELKRKWTSMKNVKQGDVKVLEASLAKELAGTNHQFEVQQIDDGEKTSTTIVLLDQDEPQEKSDSDLITLALTQSGIQDASSTLEDDLEYDELASEILYGDTEPRLLKKRLKWDKKFRAQAATFERAKKNVELQTETYKRDHNDAQKDIMELERLVNHNMAELKELQKQIDTYSKWYFFARKMMIAADKVHMYLTFSTSEKCTWENIIP